ncbi:YbjN domain-containing protein [Hyphobacterium marinum]|uniref:YbjN domain-containing protein n=1 Tax=Hyphobacterium marinum TaxID=3116574 RepID=A0ABU7M0U1_9PROT|nr:YbjN domain-containing protein [Hyphobacterium sp. Y6023]MEE2567428.1 YbjN domain-containing protein [Hyphobacterium sp. Y6023]
MELASEYTTLVSDPLDAVEQAVIAEQLPYERDDGGELHLSAPGAWRDHQIWFAWRPELDAIHICASLELKTPANRYREVCELAARLNEKLWFGHFDVWAEDGGVMYRHSVPVPAGETLSPNQATLMLGAAREAGERFYPAFQFLIWGGKSVEEAAQAAMFETAGEA